MMDDGRNSCVDDVARSVAQLTLLSFRKVEEVRRLARHFTNVINHPITQESPVVLRYLRNLNDTHRRIFLASREGVEVEYIFTTEKKSSLQRQRFNSLPVSEVPELLKAELQSAGNARQVHICTECDVEIEMNEDEPLMESLQKHFSLEVHLPKLKRESIDVAEPIVLPNMSRRLSAMECGEPSQNIDHIIQMVKPTEKLDRAFASKLETSMIYHLPDSSEASVDAAMKFYQSVYDKLCQDVSSMDFSTQTSSVAPIIMSIKDNVNQNFAADANKNFEPDENDQTPEKPMKNHTKKYRHYGHIEEIILKFLGHHMLLSLVDDRTGKLAFFCLACEFYTLRFRYDSVLNHVFSQTHIHNLAMILAGDQHIPLANEGPTVERMKNLNRQFLFYHGVTTDEDGLSCSTCKCTIDSQDATVNHILDENHLARLSDKFYRKMKATNPDAQAPEKWGPKSLDWAKFLASVGKPLNSRDHVVIENFIKPSGKIANYCTCCDMTLKGLRQVLFNHIRQKKHLRNAAPFKLSLLYKNHCRPAEYYASFGNYYVCAICPEFTALPSFAAIVEHFDSASHVETIAKLVRTALHPGQSDEALLDLNKIRTTGAIRCDFCDLVFEGLSEAVRHVLSVEHQNLLAEARVKAHRGDIISVYMGGNYILHSEGATFTCVVCSGVFNSLRALLTHLVFAEHFAQKPSAENVFRFYLELKHNVSMLARNKYEYYDFGRLRCGVCSADLEEGENAKRHVVGAHHRENMGASYVNVSMDATAVE